MEIGQLCVKLAGRDAGKKCVIVDILDEGNVLIDGSTRRRKCNIVHLIPLKETLKIKKNASHADVAKEFKKLELEVWERKSKEKTERPRKVRKGKTSEQKAEQRAKKSQAPAEKPVKEEKAEVKEEKADVKKEEKAEVKEEKAEVKEKSDDKKEAKK